MAMANVDKCSVCKKKLTKKQRDAGVWTCSGECEAIAEKRFSKLKWFRCQHGCVMFEATKKRSCPTCKCSKDQVDEVQEVDVTRSQTKTEEFGKISKLEFPNSGKIYVTKKGWTLVTPNGTEMLLPYSEINLAVKESIEQGYGYTEPARKKEMQVVSRIVNDISFARFVRELVHYAKQHPDCKVKGVDCGDDPRAEEAFMFRTKLEYEVEK